jgi:hypothetical protein
MYAVCNYLILLLPQAVRSITGSTSLTHRSAIYGMPALPLGAVLLVCIGVRISTALGMKFTTGRVRYLRKHICEVLYRGVQNLVDLLPSSAEILLAMTPVVSRPSDNTMLYRIPGSNMLSVRRFNVPYNVRHMPLSAQSVLSKCASEAFPSSQRKVVRRGARKLVQLANG